MPAFNTLGHIALKVRDLQKSIDFYTKLGFPEFLRLTEEDGEPWIVYMRFDDMTYLELFPGGEGPREYPGDRASTISASRSTTSKPPSAHLQSVGIPLTSPLDPRHPRRRPQPRHVDRRPRRQPHRSHGNGRQLHPVRRDQGLQRGKPPHAMLAPRNPKPKVA